MKDNLSRYTLRIDQTLLDKLGYIAEYEGRTKNRELEQMIKKRIRDFEQKHGEIDLRDASSSDKPSAAPWYHGAADSFLYAGSIQHGPEERLQRGQIRFPVHHVAQPMSRARHDQQLLAARCAVRIVFVPLCLCVIKKQ